MGSSVIHVMNLSDQSTQEVAAGTGEAIKPLGFMDEDFVYGIARQSDIFEDAAGNVTFPMHQILDCGCLDKRSYCAENI